MRIQFDGAHHTIEYTGELDLSPLDNLQGQPQLPVYLYCVPLNTNGKIKSFQIDNIEEKILNRNFKVRLCS